MHRSAENIRNAFSLVAHVSALALTLFSSAKLTALMTQTSATWQVLALIVCSSLLCLTAATRLRALQNMMHECSHKCLFRKHFSNETAGHALGALLGRSFSRYCRDHRSHHRFLGDPKKDRDLIRFGNNFRELAPPSRSSPTLGSMLRQAIRLDHLFMPLIPDLWERRDPIWASLLRLGTLLALGVALLAPGVSWTWKLSLALTLISFGGLCSFADHVDHWMTPKASGRPVSPFDLSRNHLFHSRILNLLLQPRHDGYHLVHHLYPAAPTRALPDLHKSLMEKDPDYASLEHHLNWDGGGRKHRSFKAKASSASQ